MTRIIGPNGLPFDVDDVVASGLLGSASGEYKLAGAEPAGEADDTKSPEGIIHPDRPKGAAPKDPSLPEGQKPPAEAYGPADKTLAEKDNRTITAEGTTSDLDEDDDESDETKTDDGDENDGAGESTTEKPAGNASHEAWVEYALAEGKSPDELDGLNRNAVRDLFKE